MTALSLTITGLLLGASVALLYWIPRAAMRARSLNKRPKVVNSFGILADPWPPPPRRGSGDTEPHIEVLKLRATRLSHRIRGRGGPGDRAASDRIDVVIKTGDHEALLAVLREDGQP